MTNNQLVNNNGGKRLKRAIKNAGNSKSIK